MTNFITKPALILKALFTVAAVATAVVAMPSGPDFAFGVSPAHAKPIKKVSKKKLSGICKRVGGYWASDSKMGTYSCITDTAAVFCTKKGCKGTSFNPEDKDQKATPPNKTGKATGPKTTGMAIRR